jgi:hypothetical protein
MLNRVRADPWPRDACPRAFAWTQGHGDPRPRGCGASTRMRRSGRGSTRTRVRGINADAGGRPDETDVRMVIFTVGRPL